MSDHAEHGGPGHGGPPEGRQADERQADERQHMWDNPRNVKLLFSVFYAACVIVAVLDLFIHRHEVHAWERLLDFYPLYGFVGIVVLVFIAKLMRRVLMRPEDYYDG